MQRFDDKEGGGGGGGEGGGGRGEGGGIRMEPIINVKKNCIIRFLSNILGRVTQPLNDLICASKIILGRMG